MTMVRVLIVGDGERDDNDDGESGDGSKGVFKGCPCYVID